MILREITPTVQLVQGMSKNKAKINLLPTENSRSSVNAFLQAKGKDLFYYGSLFTLIEKQGRSFTLGL